MRNRWFVLAALTALFSAPAGAASYVTDRLTVPVRGANAEDAPIVKQLVAGAPVTVLERDGPLLKVRTEDGSVGWISTATVTDEKPLQTLYVELSDRHNKAQEQIKTLQAQSVVAASTDNSKIVTELRAELKSALERLADSERSGQEKSGKLASAEERISSLEAEIEGLKGKGSTAAPTRESYFPAGTAPQSSWFRTPVSMIWFVAAVILTLALGVGSGAWGMDYYVRKRHGGFRVY